MRKVPVARGHVRRCWPALPRLRITGRRERPHASLPFSTALDGDIGSIPARMRDVYFLLRGAGYPKIKAIWLAVVAVWKSPGV
jgi:hypothetical protein